MTNRMWNTTPRVAAAISSLFLLAGCDLGMEESSNRYEQLNIETKKVTDILEQIDNEASAKAHLAELEAVANRMRNVQQRIADAEAKRAKKGSGGGMGRITNFRQATLFEQTGSAASRQMERIRESDAKAGDLVDKAMEGISLPPPPEPAPPGY